MRTLAHRVLPKGGFARNVATLTGATAFSQLVMLAAMPVLTRLYVPEEFGAAAVYAGILGLIAVVASLRYEFAISLPRSDRGALHVAIVACLVLVAVVVVAGLLSPVLYTWIGYETGLPEWVFTSLLVTGTATAGCYQIANYWAVRKSNFGSIARTRIQQGLAGAGSQVLLGLAGFGTLGLVLGQIVGQSAGLIRLVSGMMADTRKSGSRIHRQGLAWAAKRYRRFPLYDSWAGLFNTASAQAPTLLFAILFSPGLAGYYALATRILSAPVGLVGKAVSQALLPRIIGAGRSGKAISMVLRLLSILAWLSFVPFTVVALVSHSIVPLVFGEQWAPAASIIAWTALWTACQFVVSPLSMVMVGFEALRLQTAVQFTLLTLRIAGILIGVFMASSDVAIIGFTLASVAGYCFYLLAIGRVTGVALKDILITLAGPTLAALIVGGASFTIPDQLGLLKPALLAVPLAVWAGYLISPLGPLRK